MIIIITNLAVIVDLAVKSNRPLSYLTLDYMLFLNQLFSMLIAAFGSLLGVFLGYLISSYYENTRKTLSEKRELIERVKISARVSAQIVNTIYGFNAQAFNEIYEKYKIDKQKFVNQTTKNDSAENRDVIYLNFYSLPAVNSQIGYYEELLFGGTLYDSLPASIAFNLINSLYDLDRAINVRENLIQELNELKTKYAVIPDSFGKLYFGMSFSVNGQRVNWRKFHDNLITINDKILDALYYSICLMEISMKKANFEIVIGRFKDIEPMEFDGREFNQSYLPAGDRYRELSKRLNFYPDLLNFETETH